MANISIFAESNDGYVGRSTDSTWSGAKNATTGTFATGGLSASSQAVMSNYYAARGGGSNYRVYRAFFSFDCRSISTPPKQVSLRLRG